MQRLSRNWLTAEADIPVRADLDQPLASYAIVLGKHTIWIIERCFTLALCVEPADGIGIQQIPPVLWQGVIIWYYTLVQGYRCNPYES